MLTTAQRNELKALAKREQEANSMNRYSSRLQQVKEVIGIRTSTTKIE